MTYEEAIQTMLNDPGDQPSPEDLPDYEPTGKEISPHDLHDDPYPATFENENDWDGD